MKRWILIGWILFASSVVAAPEDEFDRGYALAEKKGCLDCHALGHDYVGPSFRSIAERYRHDPEARAQLAGVIQAGSRGHWGERFNMWPSVHLTAEELQRLVNWVLMQ
jgi:cytochrome c